MLKNILFVLVFVIANNSLLAQNKSFKFYHKIIKYDKEEEYDKIFKAEKEIIKYGEAQNDTTAAALFYILGINYWYSGEYDPAKLYLKKAIHLKNSLSWNSGDEQFDYQYYLATSEWYLEEFEKADAAFKVLIEIGNDTYEPGDDTMLFGYQEYASYLEYKGELQESDSVLSLAIRNGVDNVYTLPMLQSRQASIANELGDYQRAKELYYTSIDGMEEIKEEDPEAYASTLSNLGNLYYDLGQYPVSAQMQTKALEQLSNLGLDDSEEVLTINHNLAYTSNALGLRQKALEIYKKIIKLEEEGAKDRLKYALTLNNLGIVYHDIEKYDSAIYFFNQALGVFVKEKGTQNPDYAITLNNKAKAFLFYEKYDSAIYSSQRALDIIEKEFDELNPEIAIYENTLGLIHYAMENYSEAEFYLSKSLHLREDKLGKLNPKYAESSFDMAKLMWALERHEDANSYFSSSFESYLNQVKVFFPTMSEYERTKFFIEKIKPSVEIFYSYALENPNDLILQELMYYRLQTKGLLYYSTSNVKRSILASGNSELINNYNTWLKKRDSLAKLIQNNQSTEKINALWEEVNVLEKKISETSASFSSSAKPVFLSDIKRNLKDNETAIEIIRYNSFNPASGGKMSDSVNYAAIIITPTNKTEMIVLDNGASLESKYLRYYSNTKKFLKPDIHSYNQYWKRIEEKITQSDIIYISTDGVFNNINVNILYNPSTKKFVLDDKNVIPLTSLSDISKRSDSPIDRKTSYFFGYPTYDKLPTNSSNVSSSIDDKISEVESKASFQIVSTSLYANLISNSLFKPLPGTLVEIEEIKELYEKSNAPYKVFLKEEATESELKKVDGPTVLHIATHGFFLPVMNSSSNNPAQSNPLLQSGLVLAGAQKLQKDPSLSNENGVLTAYEAMNLNLNNTQLVVMSACETGLGTISNGEGVYGLQRAFQIAGAKSVVMSMWTVNDTATQKLMNLFYTNWLNGEDKHEAFRNAQLELKKEYPNPYYWGAFIMNGL